MKAKEMEALAHSLTLTLELTRIHMQFALDSMRATSDRIKEIAAKAAESES